MKPAHALRAALRAPTLALWLGAAAAPGADATKYAPTIQDLLAASTPADWRGPDPADILYLELASGRVVIELAPAFAPLPDRDGYAPEIGFANGFPAARDPRAHTAWLAHCYGMVGAGRDNDVSSGNGAELYVVIGNAPRQLDRNIALVGRVLAGMELLSLLPRGSGAMGFYDKPEQRVPITALRVAADVPLPERSDLEVLRTDTPFFRTLVESRRNRGGDWYKVPAGHIDLCNVPLPVRPRAAGAAIR